LDGADDVLDRGARGCDRVRGCHADRLISAWGGRIVFGLRCRALGVLLLGSGCLPGTVRLLADRLVCARHRRATPSLRGGASGVLLLLTDQGLDLGDDGVDVTGRLPG